MARKRWPVAVKPAAAVSVAPPAQQQVPTPAPAPALPPEVVRDDTTAMLLAAMMFLAPALGVPSETMLQDTLKSIIVSMTVLAAALLFFLQQRTRTEPLRWHAITWLPLSLMAYALGSMAWSHTYLAGVEAIRWFIFALLLWLALNTLARERLSGLAWGIHGGAVVAALWAGLQFWTGWNFFPQGPNPASTFVNRNFFAEFVVCTLPFSMLLLVRARSSAAIAVLAATNGWVITTILMTGTRAALIALWLQLFIAWPLIAWRCRDHLAMKDWRWPLRALAVGVMLGTVLVAGSIPSGNPKILEEERGTTAIARGLGRTQSIGPADHSLNIRMIMWRATFNILRAKPLTGVGAGAWENVVPLYQADGTQLETDYYVHNEYLQLVAEYGVVGWAFLLLLCGYLLRCAWRTWRAGTDLERSEAPWRATLLCSLLALLVVSNIGFPWRMAATGALFSLCLGALAASDARMGPARRWLASPLRWKPGYGTAAVAASIACIALALFITRQAAESERKIVQAAKIAVMISAAPDPDGARWRPHKEEMLRFLREGVAINPHYRKVTPIVADELANWGDWANATWVWESVLSSRPNVVAILSNVARGYSATNEPAKAMAYLERAQRIQPNAPAVRSLEVVLLGRAGEEAQALALAKQALATGLYDQDLVQALFVLAVRSGDYALAERAAELKIRDWPAMRVQAALQLADLQYTRMNDAEKAAATYRRAFAFARPQERAQLLQHVPEALRPRFAASAAPASQMSSSSR